ncbi:MAG: TetR/AcrR family transcriptional regulator [Patulibacter minatonensis]
MDGTDPDTPRRGPSPGNRVYGGLSADERRDRRRRELVRVGRELFADRGFSRTGVRDLCRAAKCSERSFYDTVGSREALLRDVYLFATDEVVADIRSAMREAPPELLPRLRVGLGAFFSSIVREPRNGRLIYIEALGRAPEIELARREGLGRFVAIVTDDLHRYLAGDPPPPHVIEPAVAAAITAVGEIAYRFTDGDPGFSPEQAAEHLTVALAGAGLALGLQPG